MVKPKILFVDDDKGLVQLSKKILEKAGYDVLVSFNGSDALEILRKNQSAVIICDINMPILDGNELIKIVRSDYPETDIIAITALPSVQTALETIKNGAADYIVKPINFDFLVNLINKILEKRILLDKLNNEKTMREKFSNLFNDYQDLFLATIKSLSEAIEAKDQITHGHCERICENAVTIAKKLKLSSQEINDIQYASLLHDVGKIAVPESILLKPSKLTEREFEIIKSHPYKGAKILQHIKQLGNAILGIKYHHERFDGGGYPEGLRGTTIPLIARIISVCDSFDAMISERPYREALSRQRVKEIFIEERGRQFDPKITDIFLKLNF
jgi:putative two-component system response regulator